MEQRSNTTPRLLTAVLVLQGLTLLGLWTGQPGTAQVQAAIPDPGAQREAQVAEQKATNVKLDTLIELLKSGNLKVTVKEEK
jgi:cell division protein FtsB